MSAVDERDAATVEEELIELEPPPPPSSMPSEQAPVVVIVDDDPDIRTMLVRTLGATYTIYEAADGEAARAMLESMPVPDALVCDISMPRLDGLALAKIMRTDPVLKRVPILFLTARGGALEVIDGINAGARHYLTKPFKIAEVMAKVTSMTGSAKR
jgi:DNA-binding response OmpR family regulator